jgi:hypothetical protein
MLVVHVFGFLALIIVFWVLSPRATAEVTFTQFYNGGGWNSNGLALMVGQVSAIYACICKYTFPLTIPIGCVLTSDHRL